MSLSQTQLCHCSTKGAIDNTQMNERGSISMNLYLQKQAVSQMRPAGCSVLIPVLTYAPQKPSSQELYYYMTVCASRNIAIHFFILCPFTKPNGLSSQLCELIMLCVLIQERLMACRPFSRCFFLTTSTSSPQIRSWYGRVWTSSWSRSRTATGHLSLARPSRGRMSWCTGAMAPQVSPTLLSENIAFH